MCSLSAFGGVSRRLLVPARREATELAGRSLDLARARAPCPCEQVTWKLPKQQTKAFEELSRRLTKREDLPAEVWNKQLNRHLDIMPTKQTRVLLTAKSNDHLGQYINANYVRGWDGNPRYYISAMGPLPSTVNAFWRMIVQNNVGIIAMATNLVEKGEPKCEAYWPNVIGSKMSFGKISVTTQESETYGGESSPACTAGDGHAHGRDAATLIHNAPPTHRCKPVTTPPAQHRRSSTPGEAHTALLIRCLNFLALLLYRGATDRLPVPVPVSVPVPMPQTANHTHDTVVARSQATSCHSSWWSRAGPRAPCTTSS